MHIHMHTYTYTYAYMYIIYIYSMKRVIRWNKLSKNEFNNNSEKAIASRLDLQNKTSAYGATDAKIASFKDLRILDDDVVVVDGNRLVLYPCTYIHIYIHTYMAPLNCLF